MKKILIISSRYGSGHQVPAEALREECELRGVSAEILDFGEIAGRNAERITRALYEFSTARAPFLYHGIAAATDSVALLEKISSLMPASVCENLERVIRNSKPDIVIAAYPGANHLIADMKKKYGFSFVTLVTDLADFHAYWIAPETDIYIAALQKTKETLRKFGVPEEKIRTLGYPLRRSFAEHKDTDTLKSALGIPAHKFTVVYMLHTAPDRFAGMFAKRIVSLPNTHLVAICGKNEMLRTELTRALPTAHVLGFVRNVDEYLRIADVAIGKAGTGFLMEAASCGCPVIITKYLKPQEEGNAKLFKDRGFGFIETDSTRALERLETMIEKRSTEISRDPFIDNRHSARNIIGFVESL